MTTNATPNTISRNALASGFSRFRGMTKPGASALRLIYAADVHGEMDCVRQSLMRRVKELAGPYETPLPQLSDRVTEIEEKVDGHSERMGAGMNERAFVEAGS